MYVLPHRSSHPYSHGLDVFRVVGAGKQRSKIEKLVGWLVGGVKSCNVAITHPTSDFPRISSVEVSAASNGASVICVGESCGKNKESLAVGVVLAWIDVDVKLRFCLEAKEASDGDRLYRSQCSHLRQKKSGKPSGAQAFKTILQKCGMIGAGIQLA